MVYLDENSIQQLIDAFNRRELEPGLKLFSDDVVLHCPGKSQISGDYSRKEGLLEFWQKQFTLTGGTFRAETAAVCQGEGNLVIIMNIKAQPGEDEHHWRRVNHYRVEDGRVIEGWIYESDQYTADIVFA
jgi:ketosteroid isomerase-like protein